MHSSLQQTIISINIICKNIRLSKVYLAYLRINELRQPLEEKSFRGWKKFQLESKRVPVTLVIYIP